ncbi:MAG: hypothetical protein GY754_12085 [bacterium]|nr:hypothetical protein [bacterium]
MKTGVLCSHPFAYPAIELLNSTGSLAGLGAPHKEGFTSPLKAMANQAFIPLSIIENDTSDKNIIKESLESWLDMMMPDVVFVLGFPYKIPETILSMPSQGFYNFHTGLLPAYRGIDPVFWQIRNREPFGGITVHRMDSGLDSGPIAHMEKMQILPYETYGLHLERLSFAAREAASTMMEKFSKGTPPFQEQDEQADKYLSRPAYEDLLVDWKSQPADSIAALVQASNPAYGGANTFFRGAHLRILQVSLNPEEAPPGSKPGSVVSTKNGLSILCADGIALTIDIIYTDAGLFTGERLALAFNINPGDTFSGAHNESQDA